MRVSGRAGAPSRDGGELGVVRLGVDERDALRAALTAAGLPADDLAAPEIQLFSFRSDQRTVGFGALEVHGPDVLLRSIVVAADARGEGVGREIVVWLLAHAARLGARRAYLFTTTARPYFEKLGFAVLDRNQAPQSILATRQAAGLCSLSAPLMVKALA